MKAVDSVDNVEKIWSGFVNQKIVMCKNLEKQGSTFVGLFL